MTVSRDDAEHHGARDVITVPTRRVLIGIAAEVPWTGLRHLDAIAPADTS
jgi:hypothetical protein